MYRIGDQIREALRLHWPETLTYQQEIDRIGALFELVGLNPVTMERYPNEFSAALTNF